MINVNFTLFIQAFNFLIVCLILKHLFFKPAIDALSQEKKAKDNLEVGISQQEGSLQEKVTRKENTWKTYQAHFLQTSPSAKPCPVIIFKDEIELKEVELTPQEIEQLTKHIQKSLIERIQHVRK